MYEQKQNQAQESTQLLQQRQQDFQIKHQMKEQTEAQKPSSTENDLQNPSNQQSKYKQFILIILVISIAAYIHSAQKNQTFKPYINTASHGSQDPKIYAGEIHYSRIPVQYWEHRIQMVKAMGLNALSVYVMWNYHQIQKGKFDFETENKNLTKFLYLAEQYNLTVFIRPGPYVCAQWDFGGLPARLLSVDGLEIRSSNKLFLEEVKPYFKALTPIIKEHLRTNKNKNGSITMLQIENEYGFVGTDKTYINALRQMWIDEGVDCEMYYVDWIINIRKCHWEGANIGLNDFNTQVQYDYIRSFQPRGIIFGGQIYSGWLTHWQEEKMQSQSIEANIRNYGFLMRNNHSYSMYMVHGGTNFGLTAGANAAYREYRGFGGHVTSYDYDAPINEQGNATEKYLKMRELISNYVTWEIPEIPQPKPMITIEQFTPKPIASLYDNIDLLQSFEEDDKFYPFQSTKLKMFNQGIVIYETYISSNTVYKVNITTNDVAIVTIDGKFNQILDRTQAQHHKNIEIKCSSSAKCQLRILVEAMGHINYDKIMEEDYKGLREFQTKQNEKFSWKMYKLPIDEKIFQWAKLKHNSNDQVYKKLPVLQLATFSLEETGDTYLNMADFKKGYVWVNGRNLGRYWSLGPQQKLFCPGVWLNKGLNTVHILEMNYDGDHSIKGELKLLDKRQ